MHAAHAVGDFHEARPARDSWRTEHGALRTDILRASDYPVIATCSGCGGRIRLAHVLQAEWRHVPAETRAVPTGLPGAAQ